jgi:hypothetical protein
MALREGKAENINSGSALLYYDAKRIRNRRSSGSKTFPENNIMISPQPPRTQGN